MIKTSMEVLKRRGEARFRQEARALDGRKAMTEYEAQVLAVREKTVRLRALRLAKESQALAIREKAARLTALRLAKKAQAQSDEPAPKTNVRPLKKPQSITSAVGNFGQVNTNQLCVNDTSGKTCISRAQLDAILAGTGQSPSPA